jgi:hypothetical protein
MDPDRCSARFIRIEAAQSARQYRAEAGAGHLPYATMLKDCHVGFG